MTAEPWIPERTISAEDLRSAIAAVEGRPPSSVAYFDRGFDNTVFRVDGGWLFKVSHCDGADEDIALERVVLPVIAEVLPAPIPNPRRGGEPPDAPWPFIGYQMLTGSSLVSWLAHGAATPALAGQLGEFLRILHRPQTYDALGQGVRSDRYRRTDIAYRASMCREGLDRLEQARVAVPFNLLRQQLTGAGRHASAELRQGLAHGDLHQRHVLVDQAGELAGIIDWGDMFHGAVAMDLELYWSGFEGEAADTFLASYGQPAQSELALALVVAVYTCLALYESARDLGQQDIESCALHGLRRIAHTSSYF